MFEEDYWTDITDYIDCNHFFLSTFLNITKSFEKNASSLLLVILIQYVCDYASLILKLLRKTTLYAEGIYYKINESRYSH